MKKSLIILLAMVILLFGFSITYAQNFREEVNKSKKRWEDKKVECECIGLTAEPENFSNLTLEERDEWRVKRGEEQKRCIKEEFALGREHIHLVRELYYKYISKIKIGMTDKQVLKLTGEPLKINRTITRRGTREQWVVDVGLDKPDYLYFENGILTAWQQE
jgi:hypothetical protein